MALKTYGLVSVADDKIFSHLKRKLNSNNEELRQKNKTKQKRLFLLFDNLAILKVTNDKSINTQNSIENYFNNIIFEYSNKSDSDKRQYFQSQHFISNVSNYAYYEYTLIEGFIIDKKYYQCIFKPIKYSEIVLK
ncbi:MAG: hypothetical protein IPO26_18835 [Saprospiraceae bacterium]|nr:hypothetical protein [Saprospiraceae bacterium]